MYVFSDHKFLCIDRKGLWREQFVLVIFLDKLRFPYVVFLTDGDEIDAASAGKGAFA
jgi:hypothetical protein